jgi:hypothetical protein
MAEYIDDNGDSFVDIDDFDSDEEGADLDCPEDDDSDPTILFSNTPLGTIIEEDKEADGPIYRRQQKRGLSIRQRIQALYQLDRGDPIFKIFNDTSVKKSSIYNLRTKAISLGWLPGTPIEPKYVDDLLRSGRPWVSTYITVVILTILTWNSTTHRYSCRRIA